jgi:hypothetical protein
MVMRTISEPGALHVGGVGIGHRLHDDGRIAADDDAAYIHGDGGAAGGAEIGGRDGNAHGVFF